MRRGDTRAIVAEGDSGKGKRGTSVVEEGQAVGGGVVPVQVRHVVLPVQRVVARRG